MGCGYRAWRKLFKHDVAGFAFQIEAEVYPDIFIGIGFDSVASPGHDTLRVVVIIDNRHGHTQLLGYGQSR